MSKRIPVPTGNGKRKKFGRRYPWRIWFGVAWQTGKPITLVRGTHFDVTTPGMRQMCQDRAHQLGYSIKTKLDADRDSVTVEVVGYKP